jgi:hypothetical protein
MPRLRSSKSSATCSTIARPPVACADYHRIAHQCGKLQHLLPPPEKPALRCRPL